MINGIQQFALYPILGVLMLLIGSSLDSSDKATATLLRRCRIPARWAAVGFLLMQPLVILAMLQMSLRVDRPQRLRIETLDSVRSEMRRVTNLEEVNRALARLPGAPSLPKTFNRPLPEFRDQVLSQLGRDIGQLQIQRRQGLMSRRFIEIIAYLRQLATAILLAVLYAVIGGLQPPRRCLWRPVSGIRSLAGRILWPFGKRRTRRRIKRKAAPASVISLPGGDRKTRLDHTGRKLNPYVQEQMSDLAKQPDAAWEQQREPPVAGS